MANWFDHVLPPCFQAAGGLAAGIGVKNTLIKECEEEACIPEDIAETARPVSTVR
jgi:hypothetical protein